MNKLYSIKDRVSRKSFFSVVFMVSVLCIIVGINFYSPVRETTVKLVATGEQNELSLGNNVRISKIITDKNTENEKYHELDSVYLSDNWSYDVDNHLLTSYNNLEKSEAFLYTEKIKSININFVSEIGSGIVEVYLNDEIVDRIDLYSENQWLDLEKNYDVSYLKYDIENYICIIIIVIGVLGIGFLIIANKKELKKCLLFNKVKLFRIKRAVFTGVFVVFLYVMFFTVFQNVVDDNVTTKDSVLTITATGDKSRSAVGTNVRVLEIYVNKNKYDFSSLKLENNWKYDLYDDINYMIYNYNSTEPSNIDIPISNYKTLEIIFASEIGSGIVELSIDGRKIDEVDLYKNTKWTLNYKNYSVSPFLNYYENYSTFILLFILGIVLNIILDSEDKRTKKMFDFVEFVMYNIIITVIIYIIIAFMQRESLSDTVIWIVGNARYFIDGFIILFFIEILLSLLIGKYYISFGITSLIFIICLLINYFKLQFRGMPFLPWDVLLAKVASTVAGSFQFALSIPIIISLVIILLTFIFLCLFRKREPKKPNILTRGITILVVVGLFSFYMVNFLFSVTVNLFDSKNFYLERGFVGAFFENMQYLKPIEEPENYSQETMEEIYTEINNNFTENNNEEKPNIIMLMSESFWDITRVSELNFGEEIFPTYRELQKTSLFGELLTDVYGGGTVNSEFEALTGFSVAYLPTEYMPYQRCMRPDFFSINSYLKSVGYDSLSIHPFEKTNYNRNTAYEYLNFDKSLWEEDFDVNADRMRNYISDHALTEKIIEEYEIHNEQSNSPWFNLSVSMQNHGAYWDMLIDEGKELDIDVSAFSEESQGSIKDLAIGLHYSDLALGELIDYFKNVDEPTIIIMFGDHMTNAGPIGNTLLDQSELLGENYNLSAAGKNVVGKTEKGVMEQRRVPFVAWSNYNDTNKNCGIVSVTQILPTVFSEYNVTMPKYFKYLKDCQKIYPACASNIVIRNDGSYSFVADMTEDERKQYDKNWLIEYDYIFGENYLKDLFDY